MLKLNDVYTDWVDSGLFSNMTSPIWGNKYNNGHDLDIELFTRYGNKLITPLLEHFLNTNNKVTGSNLTKLADLIEHRFREQWQHRYLLLSQSYNPLENYRMIEKETMPGSTVTESLPNETLTESLPGKTITTSNPTETETLKPDNYIATSTTTAKVQGYNSTDYVPSDQTENTTETTGTFATERTWADDTEVTESYDADKSIAKTYESDKMTVTTYENDRELTRSGNIGVTTSQQMAQSEIDLWSNYNFIDGVLNDVASMLTLAVW